MVSAAASRTSACATARSRPPVSGVAGLFRESGFTRGWRAARQPPRPSVGVPEGLRRQEPRVATARTSETRPVRYKRSFLPRSRRPRSGPQRSSALTLRTGLRTGPVIFTWPGLISVHDVSSSRQPKYLTRLRGLREIWFPRPVPVKTVESWSMAYSLGGWVRLQAKDELSTGSAGRSYHNCFRTRRSKGG